MKEPDDKGTLDAELKPYLDGQDGVSAAWRNASAEQPPAGLDALILSAARAAVHQRAPAASKNNPGNYRLAASFMVGVLVTSLYFNRQDGVEIEAVPVASAPSLSPRGVEIAGPELRPEEAPQATREAIGKNVTIAIRQVTAEAIPAPVIPAVAPPRPPTSDEPPTGITSARAVANSSALAPAGASSAAQAAQAPPEPALAQQAGAVATDFAAARAELQEAGVTQLEEIMVTGARIADATRTPGYRATQDQWLAHILALGEQVSFFVDALRAETGSLEEEIALFSETYPDVDLEAAFESQAEE